MNACASDALCACLVFQAAMPIRLGHAYLSAWLSVISLSTPDVHWQPQRPFLHAETWSTGIQKHCSCVGAQKALPAHQTAGIWPPEHPQSMPIGPCLRLHEHHQDCKQQNGSEHPPFVRLARNCWQFLVGDVVKRDFDISLTASASGREPQSQALETDWIVC